MKSNIIRYWFFGLISDLYSLLLSDDGGPTFTHSEVEHLNLQVSKHKLD